MMPISESTAFAFKVAGGLFAAAGGSVLVLPSFGRVCISTQQGSSIEPQGLSFSATIAIISSFFYTGFNLTGQGVETIFNVQKKQIRVIAP